MRFFALTAVSMSIGCAAIAPAATVIIAPPSYRYSSIADLAIAAPMVIDGTVRDVVRIKGPEAANVAAGYVRLYVTLDVIALIRGPGGVPPRIGYLYDAKLDLRGDPPKLKKQRVLLFARPVASAADQVQLISNDAQLIWSPATESDDAANRESMSRQPIRRPRSPVSPTLSTPPARCPAKARRRFSSRPAAIRFRCRSSASRIRPRSGRCRSARWSRTPCPRRRATASCGIASPAACPPSCRPICWPGSIPSTQQRFATITRSCRRAWAVAAASGGGGPA